MPNKMLCRENYKLLRTRPRPYFHNVLYAVACRLWRDADSRGAHEYIKLIQVHQGVSR